MPTRFVHDGASIDYTPGSAVTAGDVVVQGDLIGVAKRDIPANTLGSLAVEGVFDFPKQAAPDAGIAVGVNVYWDAGAHRATTTATDNKLLGKSTRAAGDLDTSVRVRLTQ